MVPGRVRALTDTLDFDEGLGGVLGSLASLESEEGSLNVKSATQSAVSALHLPNWSSSLLSARLLRF